MRWSSLAALFVAYFALYFLPANPVANLLAPGDGIVYYVPAVLREFSLWSPHILAGFPVHADLQAQAFYPLARLLPDYSLLVLSAYPIAAVGMHAFVTTLTGSRFAGLFAGFAVGSGSFMIVHLGHLTIIHAAAWVPWLLWAVQRAHLHAQRPDTLVPVAIAVALSALAGHPQIFLYGVLLAACWATWLALTDPDQRLARRFATVVVLGAAFMLGIALAAIGVLPFADLAGQGARAGWSLQDFGAYSLPLEGFALFLFPALFGGDPRGSPWQPYFGPWNLTELTAYVGLLPLALAAVAVVARRDRVVLFWATAAVIALLLMAGPATPLGQLLFHVPVLGSFRAQARFGFVVLLSVATLSGLAIAALREGRVDPRWVKRVAVGCALAFLAVLAAVLLRYGQLAPKAAYVGATVPPPWANPALIIPVVAAVASCLALLQVARRTTAGLWLCVAVMIVDLASFGFFYEWRHSLTPRTVLSPADPWASYVARIRDSGARAATVGGYALAPAPITPNLSSYFGIRNVGGYGPLMPPGHVQVAGLDSSGGFAETPLDAPIFDVLAIGWIAKGNTSQLELGGACGGAPARPATLAAPLPAEVDVRRVIVVADIACSVSAPNGTPVGTVALDGDVVGTFRAGEHVSEWSHDRADVRPIVAHARAPVASSYPAGGYDGHWYRGEVELAGRTRSVRLAPADPTVRWRIQSVTLVGADGVATSVPLGSFVGASPSAWRAEAPPPGIVALLSRQAPPFAWVVGQWERADLPAISRAAATGRLGNGRPFNAYAMALIDPQGGALPKASPASVASPGTVRALARTAGHFEFDVESPRGGLLVVSESFDDGWRATVDGVEVDIARVDGLVMGVAVPQGRSRVELDYAPRLFYLSACITLLAALACGVLAWSGRRAKSSESNRPALQ